MGMCLQVASWPGALSPELAEILHNPPVQSVYLDASNIDKQGLVDVARLSSLPLLLLNEIQMQERQYGQGGKDIQGK